LFGLTLPIRFLSFFHPLLKHRLRSKPRVIPLKVSLFVVFERSLDIRFLVSLFASVISTFVLHSANEQPRMNE